MAELAAPPVVELPPPVQVECPTGICWATVHGDKIDGHFYETAIEYFSDHIGQENARLGGALREAADHIPDQALADKYRAIAMTRPFQWATANLRSGPLLSAGRGAVTAGFVDNTDCEWVFMTDTDQTWDPKLPQQMVQCAQAMGIKILGAPVWMIHTNQDGTIRYRQPNTFKLGIDHDGTEVLIAMSEADLLGPPGGQLMKVAGLGAAILLVHRDVFIKIRDEQCHGLPHWWHHLPTPDGLDQYGEDTSFCIRARRAGFDLYIHTGIRVGHAKTIVQY